MISQPVILEILGGSSKRSSRSLTEAFRDLNHRPTLLVPQQIACSGENLYIKTKKYAFG